MAGSAISGEGVPGKEQPRESGQFGTSVQWGLGVRIEVNEEESYCTQEGSTGTNAPMVRTGPEKVWAEKRERKEREGNVVSVWRDGSKRLAGTTEFRSKS